MTIDDLEPGMSYKFILETKISEKGRPDLKSGDKRIVSRSVIGRTRAPCLPPRPIVTGYTTDTVNLYWDKPEMYVKTGKMDRYGNPRHVKLALQVSIQLFD